MHSHKQTQIYTYIYMYTHELHGLKLELCDASKRKIDIVIMTAQRIWIHPIYTQQHTFTHTHTIQNIIHAMVVAVGGTRHALSCCLVITVVTILILFVAVVICCNRIWQRKWNEKQFKFVWSCRIICFCGFLVVSRNIFVAGRIKRVNIGNVLNKVAKENRAEKK